MIRIRILQSAWRDIDAGYAFYESQESGAGEYFLESIRAQIDRLRISGGAHRIVHRNFHRLICRTFPFAVYYTCEKDVVTVYAVVDARRDPAWILRHLKSAGDQTSVSPDA